MTGKPIRTMKRPYQAFGVVLFLASAAVAVESLSLKFYTPLGPGPGFFPFWLALVLAILSVVVTARATFLPVAPMRDDFVPSTAGLVRLAATIGALAATVGLMRPLGFRLTMLGFYMVLFLSLGRQRLLLSLLIAVLGSFGVYQIFVTWLDVPLPIGRLGF